MADARGTASDAAIAFFRLHDCSFRIRRLRLLARRLTQDWEDSDAITEEDRDRARDVVYDGLVLYQECEASTALGADFRKVAADVLANPQAVLDHIAGRRGLAATDILVDGMLAAAMAEMPAELRRRLLLAYLGFPFYDTVTLPLLRGEGLQEFDPVKVDRISPDDARSIRQGGAQDTLRGIEFYNFGAFFSRSYRENDYLWGRLHGAERMIDLMASALPDDKAIDPTALARFKRLAFLAILDEEEGRLMADRSLVDGLREEVLAMRNA